MFETIGIIGIGKLGLSFALNLERSGFRVLGVDVHQDYIRDLNEKTFKSEEPFVDDLLQSSRNFLATHDLATALNECSILFIAVATPTSPHGGYDHSQVERVLQQLISFGVQKSKKHLVISCTTLPGFCDQAAQLVAAFNYTLSYNPEFIAQGSIIENQLAPDQILIGEADKEAGDAIEQVYRQLCKNEPAYCRMSRLSAEICKLATNCFLTTKIAFANAIGDLAVAAGAEPDKILNAIGSDSRIGKKYLNYGFGFGGPCFPRDNRALELFADNTGVELYLSRATEQANAQHLDFMFLHWMRQHPNGLEIVFDSVTYKPGISMLEESQQLALAVKLAQAGKRVKVRETSSVIEEVRKIYGDLFTYEERN